MTNDQGFVIEWIEYESDYNQIKNLVDEYLKDNPNASYPRCVQNGDMDHIWGSLCGYESDMSAFANRYQCEHVIQDLFSHWVSVSTDHGGYNHFADSEKHDSVSHPTYYSFAHEPIDVIADWGLNFNLGNTVKYISRAGRKDPTKTLEDLKKARFYLDYEIKHFGEEE